MPIYEYECTKCGHRFEMIQAVSAAPVKKCEKCKGKVERLISSPAIQFKGSGWYVTDYARKSGPTEGKETKETKSKESKGSTKSEKSEKPEKAASKAAAK